MRTDISSTDVSPGARHVAPGGARHFANGTWVSSGPSATGVALLRSWGAVVMGGDPAVQRGDPALILQFLVLKQLLSKLSINLWLSGLLSMRSTCATFLPASTFCAWRQPAASSRRGCRWYGSGNTLISLLSKKSSRFENFILSLFPYREL